ncbi:peroxiredoxin family protein [Schlesneria paludicola]|uniref:peroxiredoxin family protein n=1 Tax=Schlesneria paludicola TaxID=360056 RepID=UPI0012F8C2BA|nr:redoxin domain-containing protein [Schlesneria paludicola]
MNLTLTGLVLWMAATDLPVGTELHYAGTLSQSAKAGGAEVKSFTLYATVATAQDGSTPLAYALEERGGGGWGWPEHFGVIPAAVDAKAKSRPIRILYSHDGQQYPLAIRSPLFEFREHLAPQSTWSDGKYQYTTTRSRKFKDRSCVQIEATTPLGRNQTLIVESETGLLVSLDERVIIGRGDEFQLKMELDSQTLLEADGQAKNRKPLESLLVLQTSLNRTGGQRSVELTNDQADLLKNELPRIEDEAEGTGWTRLVAAISRDLTQQRKRLDGVEGLQSKLVGHPCPAWTLKLTNGKTVTEADYQDKVLVLHFWQYRGEPLTEPYGQVGYLDFLYGKRKKLGVSVLGVNIDPRFANPQQASAATRSMKALLDFMRLGYDMATDDGTILTTFGDPRSLGAPLPLWIVIGHDGRITHYHTGFYDIKPDEGLKQLDEAVVEALRRQKAK